MRYPISNPLTVTGKFKERAQPGTGLPDARGVRRHIGVDLRARSPRKLYAVGDGVVTASYKSASSGMQVIELRVGKYLWRFLHLSQRGVRVGQKVREGQLIGRTGNSGGVPHHLHFDARKPGTAWNASLKNYVDPMKVIADSQVRKVRIQLRGTKRDRYNVHTAPLLAAPTRTRKTWYGKTVPNYARGGQRYTAVVDNKGWAKIKFAGATGYVHKSTYRVI